jgi:hypothetical protein
MALVIGQAAAMAASQMNRPYGPRYHAAINEWLNANDLARHRRKACRGVAYFRRANRKPKERRAGPTLPGHWEDPKNAQANSPPLLFPDKGEDFAKPRDAHLRPSRQEARL